MSIDDIESSSYGAAPMQLFDFSMGVSSRWGYLSGDTGTYTWNNFDFIPDPIIALGEVSQSLAESSPSIQIEISSTSEVARLFIPYLPPEPIQVRVYRMNMVGDTPEYAPEFIGEVVSSAFDESTGACTLTCRMVSAAMSRNVPWCVFSTNCSRALYGIGCDVNRLAFLTTTNVVGGAGSTVLSSADFATAAVDHAAIDDPEVRTAWFRNGYVRHVLSGEVRTIIDHDGSNIYLHTPFTTLVNGDEVEAYAGCNRERGHCRKKFNNLDRFLGFPWQPNKNPYTQNVYGTGSTSTAATTPKSIIKSFMEK